MMCPCSPQARGSCGPAREHSPGWLGVPVPAAASSPAAARREFASRGNCRPDNRSFPSKPSPKSCPAWKRDVSDSSAAALDQLAAGVWLLRAFYPRGLLKKIHSNNKLVENSVLLLKKNILILQIAIAIFLLPSSEGEKV